MKRLLVTQVVTPNQIAFISGDIIDDYHQLLRICQSYLEPDTRILIVDEVTYIREWDRAIKFLADTGALERISVMLSGSDSGVLSEARSRFPGRRGMSDRQDFELLPLSFRQCVALKLPQLTEYSDDVLEEQWEEYLLHGGYLTAINQYVDAQKIPVATLATYSDWIRGDFLKRNKNENTLMEVVTSLLQRLGSQITWNALAKSLSIEHPATLASYVEMLSTMSVVVVQSALDQNKLRAAPKKAKKIHVVDPFIYHALYNWIRPSNAPFEEQMTKAISCLLYTSDAADDP